MLAQPPMAAAPDFCLLACPREAWRRCGFPVPEHCERRAAGAPEPALALIRVGRHHGHQNSIAHMHIRLWYLVGVIWFVPPWVLAGFALGFLSLASTGTVSDVPWPRLPPRHPQPCRATSHVARGCPVPAFCWCMACLGY